MKLSHPAVRKIMLAVISLVLAICIGTVTMIAVYCLPTRRMNDNVGHSLYIIEGEGNRFTWAPGYAGTGLDGYTDAIMLGNAVYRGTGSHLRDAMLNPRAVYLPHSGPMGDVIKYVNQSELVEPEVKTYSRYWHGYLAWLKPMLLFFTLPDIRMMNMAFQLGLALYVLLKLFQLGSWKLTVPFAVMLLSINPISTALCLQYSSVYTTLLLGALALVQFRLYDTDYDWYVFLWIGILTAFLDFLTYPVAALGVNLVLINLLHQADLKERILRIARATAAWCLGYIGMWAGKWIVAFVLTGYDAIGDALGAVANRSGSAVAEETAAESASALDVIRANLQVYQNSAAYVLAALLILLLVVLLLSRKYRPSFSSSRILALLLIALYPFVWYAAIRNHSFVHYWMTHRNLSVTIFAITALFAYSFNPKAEVNDHG